jgi:hypothetical protein
MAFGNAKNILLGQKGNGDLGFMQASEEMKTGLLKAV